MRLILVTRKYLQGLSYLNINKVITVQLLPFAMKHPVYNYGKLRTNLNAEVIMCELITSCLAIILIQIIIPVHKTII